MMCDVCVYVEDCPSWDHGAQIDWPPKNMLMKEWSQMYETMEEMENQIGMIMMGQVLVSDRMVDNVHTPICYLVYRSMEIKFSGHNV